MPFPGARQNERRRRLLLLRPLVGNPRGGRTAAILASLTSTCRRHHIDPHIYLTQLLTNLPHAPHRDLPAWLPDRGKLDHRTGLAKLENDAVPAS
jgi:hypothetical protein